MRAPTYPQPDYTFYGSTGEKALRNVPFFYIN
jgi:hypothetical protein